MADDKEREIKKELKETHLPQYEKQQYLTLLKIYSIAAAAIILIVAVGVWFFGGSIGEAKDNLTKDLVEVKSDIKSMKSEALGLLENSNNEANRQREEMRKNIESYLTLTKDITALQIDAIREDARNLALSSARAKIEEAFQVNDIQEEIREAARREIGDQLDLIVRRETEKMKMTFQESIDKTTAALDDLPIISQATTMIYLGSKSSVMLLDSLSNYHNNESIRFLSEKTLLQKGVDYDNFILSVDAPDGVKYNPEAQFGIKIDSSYSHNDQIKLIKNLINIIETDDDLYVVSSAFMALRHISKKEIKTFDMTAIKNLKKAQ